MVITDAHLTGMNGYDLLSRLRQTKPELPVLMITAYATAKLAVEAIKAGAIDYLSKPFEPEELLHAVARCAERLARRFRTAALGRNQRRGGFPTAQYRSADRFSAVGNRRSAAATKGEEGKRLQRTNKQAEVEPLICAHLSESEGGAEPCVPRLIGEAPTLCRRFSLAQMSED